MFQLSRIIRNIFREIFHENIERRTAYSISDARKTLLAFAALLQGNTPSYVEQWEQELAERTLSRSRQLQTILFMLVFVGALTGSIIVGEVRIDTFVEGLPNFFNYINPR